MSLSNLSQLLVRNIDLLISNNPLLINFPVDSLDKEWKSHYPDAKLTYFTNNRLEADQLNQKTSNQLTVQFGSYYQSNTLHDLVIIAFPKSKAELAYTLAMLNDYLTDDALILLVGENKGGIKSAPKLTKDTIKHCTKIDSARHCVLFQGQYISNPTPFNQNDWFHIYTFNLRHVELKVAALPGVFSQQKLDKGTRVLLENLPINYKGKVLDFGCGAGVISAYIGLIYPSCSLHLLDISALAIASAKKTLELNQLSGHTLASNGLSNLSEKYDHIVSNPPFHQGINTQYKATEDFLEQCNKYLTRSGNVTVVANSFLKYRSIMEKSIGTTELVITENGFSIFISHKKSP